MVLETKMIEKIILSKNVRIIESISNKTKRGWVVWVKSMWKEKTLNDSWVACSHLEEKIVLLSFVAFVVYILRSHQDLFCHKRVCRGSALYQGRIQACRWKTNKMFKSRSVAYPVAVCRNSYFHMSPNWLSITARGWSSISKEVMSCRNAGKCECENGSMMYRTLI